MLAAGQELTEADVARGEFHAALEQVDDALPAVVHRQRLVGDGEDRIEFLLEEDVDELLAVGKAAVDGADAHVGLARDRLV